MSVASVSETGEDSVCRPKYTFLVDFALDKKEFSTILIDLAASYGVGYTLSLDDTNTAWKKGRWAYDTVSGRRFVEVNGYFHFRETTRIFTGEQEIVSYLLLKY